MNDFKRDLAAVLNAHGFDTLTNTPDHVLADFLHGILLIMPRRPAPPPVIPLPPLEWKKTCHYCGAPPTGGFDGKPCCGPCAERLLQGAPTTTDPLPPATCCAYKCQNEGTHMLEGFPYCISHFQEFSKLTTTPPK